MKSIKLTLAFAPFVWACSHSNASSNDAAFTQVASDDAGGFVVDCLASQSPHTGLNALFFQTSGEAAGTLTVTATSTDVGGVIGAPILSPANPSADGLFEIDAIFPPTSSTDSTWNLALSFAGQSDVATTASILLTVADDGASARFSNGNTFYIASMNFTDAPTIGVNPIVVTLAESTDNIAYIPVTDATVAIDPEMPSMGHGSTGSTPPTPTSLGQYAGTVSFTMAGTWVTTLTFTENNASLGSAAFTTTL